MLRAKRVRCEPAARLATSMRAFAAAAGNVAPAALLVDAVRHGQRRFERFHLSTAARAPSRRWAFRVAKHGSTAVSSKSGSADVDSLARHSVAARGDAGGRTAWRRRASRSFSLPHYHPAMKAIIPVRQALGVRTVFNILGRC